MRKRIWSWFKKRDYLRILNDVVDFCLQKFGYSIRPYIFESELDKGILMEFRNVGKRKFAIFYDYKQFRRACANDSYEYQEALVMATAAHEMRHYYQVRQIYSRNPVEPENTIAEWRENHFHDITPNENGSNILEFYLQPMELDAELYAYYFVAKTLNRGINLSFIDDNYIHILKNKFIEIFGDDHPDLYIFDAWDK